MAKKGFTPEQVINKLREAEILLNQGITIVVVSKKIGGSDHTYYRWRKEYGGMGVDLARRRCTLMISWLPRNSLPRAYGLRRWWGWVEKALAFAL